MFRFWYFTQFQDSISFSDVTTQFAARYIFLIQYTRKTVHLIKDVIAYSRKLLILIKISICIKVLFLVDNEQKVLLLIIIMSELSVFRNNTVIFIYVYWMSTYSV